MLGGRGGCPGLIDRGKKQSVKTRAFVRFRCCFYLCSIPYITGSRTSWACIDRSIDRLKARIGRPEKIDRARALRRRRRRRLRTTGSVSEEQRHAPGSTHPPIIGRPS